MSSDQWKVEMQNFGFRGAESVKSTGQTTGQNLMNCFLYLDNLLGFMGFFGYIRSRIKGDRLPYNWLRDVCLSDVGGNKKHVNDLLLIMDQYFKNVHTILDIGTGKGHFPIMFNEKGYQCYGVDLLNNFQRSSNFLISDMKKLPFQDNSFDMVHERKALTDILELQEGSETEVYEVLGEINRVLKPGGYFCGIILYQRWMDGSNGLKLQKTGFDRFYQKLEFS